MLKRLLIANRGEIARRIIRTARRMGVETVAVYSDADAAAPFVAEADRAVHIGPAPARESYLDPAKVLAAARESGADSIHAGYGFLSENADFAERVIAAGLIWVGPPPSAIRAMGLKDAAKRLMSEAGVPVTPGYQGEDQAEARLQAEADRIGYPVLIKAVAGGGGKGMRKVEVSAEFAAALASCRREAAASFGDDRVLIETYVTRPRHVEVQVFADRHGNAVHLFERDCSLQRRHQKVIEEAPAPGMDPAVREAVCAAAVRAAQAVAYEGAGTIEFIADASEGLRADRIWFMEMNTRLQVEHPVTEAITGQDLVEWQLRVASGEPLPKTQGELAINGHAMEARLYAENPATGFLPSIGRLERFRLPDGVRVDSAVEEGGEVTPFYDPMIAKLISHAPTREGAAASLAAACEQVEVWPVKTNAAFLARCLAEPDFVAGHVDTGFIGARLDALALDPPASPEVLVAAATLRLASEPGDPTEPWRGLEGFRLNAPPCMEVRLQDEAGAHVVQARSIRTHGRPAAIRTDEGLVVFVGGAAYAFTDPSSAAGGADAASDGAVISPMPGRIVQVSAKAGDAVAKGAPLLTLEAMKMEHVLVAPFDGVVVELDVRAGDQVGEGATLVRLECA
ncbi:biotin carboxylase N-terminal domain-containing protein [Caulobacter sp. S45]|uniref:acetyl/propionyl/methylcrotonyl-CoA carboxylase subunit alpha n=1 Tax=Caulobacter sp. S45 TaxID=1641861 RepID=UPI00131E953E|nr:biotin carboxylase N-terminal domain-containing protein [Caulobacter sp. S45]